MEAQRERARAAWAGSGEKPRRRRSGSVCASASAPPISSATIPKKAEGVVRALLRQGEEVDALPPPPRAKAVSWC